MKRGLRAMFTAVCVATVVNAGVLSQQQTTSPATPAPVYVTATDRAGGVVTDLRAEDISIRLDGKPVGPISLSRQWVEISAVLIIDTSFSMRPWLNAMSTVALEFFSHLRPRDRALVTEMHGHVPLGRAFTSNRDALSAQLNLQTINATHFFDTVLASADALRNESAH